MQRLRGKTFFRWRGRKLNWIAAGTGLCLMWLWMGAAAARAATFTASLDNDTLTVGQSTTLSLSFEGGQPRNLPSPVVPGLQIVKTGNSQSFSIRNNQMSSTVTVTFSVTPQRTGQFTIPAITVDVNGQTLTSQPLQLRVVQPRAASTAQINSGSELAFMRLSLPDTRVYAGEIVTGDLDLYLRDDVRNFANFQFTARPADGFTLGKMHQGRLRREQIGNRVYNVVPIVMSVTATRPGKLTLGPLAANVTLLIASPNQPNNPFRQFGFQDPFGNFGEVQRQVSLATETLTVKSLPLPTNNVPPGFNGAIGEYTMTVTAGPTNVAVGDPITVHIRISGRGDLSSITLPRQSTWHDFTVYPPTSKLATTDPLGLQGTRTFEEIVAPQNTDVRELPPFTFSYFDPDTGNYRTLSEPSVALAVRSAGATPVPTIAAAQNAGSQRPAAPADILPIKDELGVLAQAGAPLVTRPTFLAVQSLPVLAFLAALIWRQRTDRLANNPRLRRQRHVAQLVRNGLTELRRLAAENKPDEFFATVFRLLQEQLGERLDCPASSITESVVDERLAALNVPEPVLDDLRELFQFCNQARYAPIRGTAELNSVAEQLETVIGKLQEVKI